MKTKTSIPLIALLMAMASCSPENPEIKMSTGFLHGAFVTNEGGFGNSNGSVSYIDTDSSLISNHLFESVNGRPLGDVVFSLGIAGDKGFIVVNNSQKVEVVDLKTFASLGTITGPDYPRYFLACNESKGYLTNGNFSGSVYVIDIESLAITDTIPCGFGPEKMILNGKKLIVANSGGWGSDSTLTVIDTGTDRVTATWKVGDNPADLDFDQAGNLWVLCKGRVVWNPDFTIGLETQSTLVELNPAGEVVMKREIGHIGDYYWPQQLMANKGGNRMLYLESDGIRSVSWQGNDDRLLIPGYFYGFGSDPASGMIYGLAAPSFTAAGWVYRFLSDGSPVDTLEAGIGPSHVVFN